MNQSYWQKTTRKKIEKVLEEDLSVDVLIIGGGLAGVSLAYQLKDTSLKVAVIEKNEIGSHTSGHTTAKLTVLHDLLYQKITEHYDIHQAYLYYQSNLKALEEIKNIIHRENIDCDYIDNSSFIYTDNPEYVKDIQKQKEIFKSLRIDIIEDSNHLASLGLQNQAIFHPLKYLFSLVKLCQKAGVTFYEQSQAMKIERLDQEYKVKVNQHYINCQYVVHATRYPFIKNKLYFMKLFQEREYIDYKESQESIDSYLCIDESKSYRPLINHDALEINRDSKDWFAQDSIPLRGIPYIGRLNKNQNEFIIYGFQKWGMTLSQVAAIIISDLILDRDNSYEELYHCDYFSLSFAKQYTQKVIYNVKTGFWTNRFETQTIESLNMKEGAIVRVDGKLKAVYKDSQEQLHYFSPYCPHLKCIIGFDQKSQTWLCPCHQSSYDPYGNIIEGPTLYPLKEE